MVDEFIKFLQYCKNLHFESFQGLSYIHSTTLQFHGRLSSLSVMIDKRFCVRICGHGATKFSVILRSSHEHIDGNIIIPHVLWMSQEMLQDEKHSGSKEADIFSLGIVITEVLTKNAPIVTDVSDIAELKSESSHPVPFYVVTFILLSKSNLPPRMNQTKSPWLAGKCRCVNCTLAYATYGRCHMLPSSLLTRSVCFFNST